MELGHFVCRLDGGRGGEKTRDMSRHRTTMKMHRASDKGEPSRPSEATAVAGESVESPPEPDVASKPSGQDEVLTVETLSRYLAAEVSEREAVEERTTTVLARYFKLTFAMGCLNMVVAGVSVALLFSYSSNLKTIVAAQPAAAALPAPAAPPPPLEQARASLQPVIPPPSPPPPVAPPLVAQPPAKVPLLGQPAAPRRAPTAGVARSPRIAAKPMQTKPTPAAASADEEGSAHPSRPTERW